MNPTDVLAIEFYMTPCQFSIANYCIYSPYGEINLPDMFNWNIIHDVNGYSCFFLFFYQVWSGISN